MSKNPILFIPNSFDTSMKVLLPRRLNKWTLLLIHLVKTFRKFQIFHIVFLDVCLISVIFNYKSDQTVVDFFKPVTI